MNNFSMIFELPIVLLPLGYSAHQLKVLLLGYIQLVRQLLELNCLMKLSKMVSDLDCWFHLIKIRLVFMSGDVVQLVEMPTSLLCMLSLVACLLQLELTDTTWSEMLSLSLSAQFILLLKSFQSMKWSMVVNRLAMVLLLLLLLVLLLEVEEVEELVVLVLKNLSDVISRLNTTESPLTSM
jgi:hypothetical protein